MVPVGGSGSAALVKSFALQLKQVESKLNSLADGASVESWFVHYLFSEIGESVRLKEWQRPTPPKITVYSNAPDLAAFGYVAACSSVGANEKSAWIAAIERLRARDPLPPDRQAFAFRPLELLGISLGAKHLDDSGEYREWLRAVFPKVGSLLSDPWSTYLLLIAETALGGSSVPKTRPILSDLVLEDVSLLLWVKESNDFREAKFVSELTEGELREVVLQRCAGEDPEVLDAARAGLVWFAVSNSIESLLASSIARNWQVGQSERDALSLVLNLCERFPRFTRQLFTRHDNRAPFVIRDEYDVQDLLHALLLLFFDDVREEEWTPKYAGSASRTDFLLWKEHLVVEAKMTRKGLDQRKLADELIIDKERYQTHPRCKTLVCFVYDPEHRCDAPAALENDLSADPRLRVRVVVAPR